MNRRKTFLLFSVVLIGLVAFVMSEKPPRPIYKRTEQHTTATLIPIPTGKDFSWSFDAPGPNIRTVWLRHAFADPKHEVSVRIENLTRGVTLWEKNLIGMGTEREAAFPSNNAAGDRIRITYRVVKSRLDRWPTMAQAVKRSFQAADYPIEVAIDGVAQDAATVEAEQLWPLFQLRYQQRAVWLLWLWPGLLIGMAVLFVRKAGRSPRMIYLLLVATASVGMSAGLWAQRYEHNGRFDDPDMYGLYAEKLLAWPDADEAGRAAIELWIREYRNTHIALVPVTMTAIMKVTGAPMFGVYLYLVGLASFGTLLLLDWWVAERLKLSARGVLLAVSLLAANMVFLKCFIKASTDAPGAFLTTAAWMIVAVRLRREFRWWEELLFSGFLFALATVRPPGMAYLAFFCTAAAIVDMIRARRLISLIQLRAMALYFLPVAAAIGFLYWRFDWLHNLGLAGEYAKNYHNQANFFQWYPTFITTTHVFVLAAAGLRLEDFRRSEGAIPAIWAVFYLTLLALVKAAFILRIFSPAGPAIYAIAALGIERLVKRWPWWTLAAGLTIMVINLALLWWQLQLPSHPPAWALFYLYF